MPNILIDNISKDSKIEEDTKLFRITSPTYATDQFLLNGKGSLVSEGRYHIIHQRTSYASNNVLLCIAEVLFHMIHQSLKKLKNNSYGEFKKEAHKEFVIVMFKCYEISDLVFIDSSEAYIKYSLNPSITTHPHFSYDPLRNAANTIRRDSSDGIIYSSARHSKGLSVCFLEDKTQIIKSIENKLKITLTLVSEDKNLVIDKNFDPSRVRLNYEIGYFDIDTNDFKNFRTNLNPILPDHFGFIDIGRRDYSNPHVPYPDSAIKRTI